jgi:uncharacterized protein (TIGR02646 family)
MIRVVRPAKPPAILQSRGKAERQKLCHQFDSAPDDYKNGKKKLSFKARIYGHSSVKQALQNAQHDKCAFCESKATAAAYGDVEHFRPKAGFQQGPKEALQSPGYYWLAYEWTNLLFACQICNQQSKRNLFPLANPDERAISHHHDIDREEPLLIDPAGVDPGRYIGFRDEVAFPRNGSGFGKTTIDVVRLNRAKLLESRRTLLAWLKIVADQRSFLRRKITECRGSPPADLVSQLRQIDAQLAACQEDNAEFAGMARAALAE